MVTRELQQSFATRSSKPHRMPLLPRIARHHDYLVLQRLCYRQQSARLNQG
jgi:hypothetical protein